MRDTWEKQESKHNYHINVVKEETLQQIATDIPC